MANDVADLLLRIDASTEGLRREIKRAESAVEGGSKEIETSTKKIDKSFTSMGDTVKKVAGVVVAAIGAMQVGRKFSDVVVETEKLRGSLTTITGSAENAAMAFNKLTEFAAQTPFTLDQSVNAFIKLKALGLDPSERALMSYGNTASAMGKDMMQMIEAVADAATMEFERLKEFGIRAKQEGDNVSFTFQGVTTTVAKNSQEIQEYLLAIGETQFAGAMEDQMSRLPGLLSNLQDNVDGLFRKIGDIGGISLFGSAIASASGAIVYLTENIEGVLTALSYAGAAMSGPLILGAFALVIKAVVALNAALLANPILLVAAAFSTAAYAIYRNWDEITAAAERASIAIQIAWNQLQIFLMESFSPALTAIRDMFDQIRNRAIATWNGISAAAADPLNAIGAFNEAFDSTIAMFDAAGSGADVFTYAIENAKGEIVLLEGRLAKNNSTLVVADGVITNVTGALSDFAGAAGDGSGGTNDLNKKAKELIISLRQQQAALALGAREQAIYNAVMSLGTDATAEQIVEVARLTGEIYDQQKAIGFWTQAAKNGAKERGAADEAAARATQEAYQRTHEFVTTTILDIADNGGNAFQKLGDIAVQTAKRIAAEWLALKAMNLFGISMPGGGGGSVGGGIMSSVIGKGASAVGSAVSGGFATGGISGAVSGGAGAIASGVAAIPGWGWALGGAALLASQLDKSTPSGNAGLLIHDAPGADPSQKFQVAPFASGFAPVGFARREDQGAANQVIDIYRQYDAALTQIANAAGIMPNFSNNPFGGYDENAQGNGLFLGVATEDGKVQGVPVEKQLDHFVGQWIDALGGQISPEERAIIKSAGSADEMIKKAAQLAGVDGSHRNGLDYVPFDGYRAELHRGERVMTASENAATSGMAGEFRMMRQELIRIAQQTKRTSDILLRVTRDGEALLTEAV